MAIEKSALYTTAKLRHYMSWRFAGNYRWLAINDNRRQLPIIIVLIPSGL